MNPATDREPGHSPAIRAAVDRIIPADAWVGGWDGGVQAHLESPDAVWGRPALERLAARLDRDALSFCRRSGRTTPESGGLGAGSPAERERGFAGLSADEQDAVLAGLEHDADLEVLRRLAFEGYYAARPGASPAGLEMIGFRAVPEGVEALDPPLPPTIDARRVRRRYDAVVIGSGPGGGSVARVLAAAGKEVLILERARALPNSALRGDHLHGKRNAVYSPTAGPGAGHPRVHMDEDGTETVVDGDGDASLYGLNAMAFGGGTRLWQCMAWRFMPEDFAMETVYGQPEGASLADWPVSYDEMEPYYARAEDELGVAGEQGGLTRRMRRSADYPMPAMPGERSRDLLGAAADRLGWGWGPIPLAINSVPRNGRAACVRCPQCVGHACPVDAKNGSHNTFVPLALATGRAELLLDAEAVHVADGDGTAVVTVMAEASGGDPLELEIEADVVVVSAGAVETPRLLMASGLGNDQLGRYLHDHRFVPVLGLVDPPAKTFLGPGHAVASLEHVHAPTIPWGGGVLVDLMSMLPLTMAQDPPLGDVARWGLPHKRWMREGRTNVFGVFGMGQEIPLPSSRVTLADVRDRWGRPGARIRKDTHPTSLEVEAGMTRWAEVWLREAGVSDVGPRVQRATASAAGEHSCGTARMGDDPARSATGADGRLHGAKRIWVADASLHPTNGSVNPALTIVANSLRVADRLLDAWP